MTRRLPLIFWIVLLSFLLRLAFISWVPLTEISESGDDAGIYHSTALQLRGYLQKGGPLLMDFFSGKLFHSQGMLEKYGLEIPWWGIKKGPVYPLFVSLFYWILGPDPFWVFMVQALLLSFVGALFYGTAKELGRKELGLLCAFLIGTYPPFIFITSKLLQENLSIFLFAFFYFLAFRSWRTNSSRLFGLTGIVLFLLALTKSRLAPFPFFLFGMMGVTSLGMKKRRLPTRNLLVFFLSFLIPYALWAGVVSWQLQRPSVLAERGGMQTITGLLPDYEGWLPDEYQADRAGPEVQKILDREGVRWSPGEERWPSGHKLVLAGLRILWKHPGVSIRMGLERFRRLWWGAYDWPWREFLFSPQPLRWLHRGIVVASLFGMVLWGFERPLAVWFLAMPLLYAVPAHALFHIEHRYLLPFIPFLFPFASFFIHFLWRERKILVGSFQEFTFGLGLVLTAGFVFRLSQTPFAWKLFPVLSAYQAHFLAAGLRSLLLIGFFLVAGFWLKRILPQRRLFTSLGITAFFILIPFGSHSFTARDWYEWKASLRQATDGIRQEIFLPLGSLDDSVSRHLRIDLLLPKRGEGWSVQVNGESIGTLETLKAHPSPFLLGLPYSIYLEDAKRKAYEMRQWFSLPIPPHLLREGAFNTVEIVFDQEDSAKSSLPPDEWVLFGDYPVSSPSPQFYGPFFLHSTTEFSVFKFHYDRDLRINGVTLLHHQGVKSVYLRGGREVADDLSDSPGIQRGEYRIRIEIEGREGRPFVY